MDATNKINLFKNNNENATLSQATVPQCSMADNERLSDVKWLNC